MKVGEPKSLSIPIDLYLQTEHRTICGVIHNLQQGKWASFYGLDQLLLYLDDIIS